MTSPGNTGVIWQSRRGLQRSENQDVGAVVRGACFTVGMIADAFGLHTNSSDYPKAFLQFIAQEILRATDMCVDDCVNSIRKAHANLRRRYAGHRFCFALLFLSHQRNESWSVHCGDCRIGTSDEVGSCSWSADVHSAAIPHGESFGQLCIGDPRRHIVTRSIGTRSPSLAVHRIDADPSTEFLLATDGYWTREMQRRLDHAAADDSSVLRVTSRQGCDMIDSDCDNFTIHRA